MSLKGKLWILPLLVLAGFSGTFILNYNLAEKNNQKIENLKSLSYPTLEITDVNINNIEKIPNILNNAVSSGELPLIDETKEIAKDVRMKFEKAKVINKENKLIIEKIEKLI